MAQHLVGAVAERAVAVHEVAQPQAAVAARVDRPDLDVGVAVGEVVLLGQRLAQVAVAVFVVDGGDGAWYKILRDMHQLVFGFGQLFQIDRSACKYW